MNRQEPDRLRITCRTEQGRLRLVLEGRLDPSSVWELLRRLEATEPGVYPLVLDLNGIEGIHWFASSLLCSALARVVREKGRVLLALPGKPGEVAFDAERLDPDLLRWP
ncbi:hypothetical protein [Nitrospira sp. Kam-Ns4a]